ncbi:MULTISPECIES: hypothetical protein [Cupriavidus]|uniref:hypothetical protein n=1 Tax=Cupriavidus TaxID=106589 RepID=UPI0020A51330|nr:MULTISPECIES: hypothetical protein [Cupriavidus]MDT6959924.1 hypothetical protein [Cupriavidus sp. SZY C1]
MSADLISAQARHSLAHVLHRAVRSRLVLDAGDPCTITDAPPATGDAAGSVVVLTIASMGFRYMLFLRFGDDPATAGYYAATGDLRDALLERGNLCCGAINQDLGRHFPDLGMSTPYVLDAACLRHVDSLHPDHRADFDVVIGPAVHVAVTMCLFTRVPVDFHVAPDAEEATTDGELELF